MSEVVRRYLTEKSPDRFGASRASAALPFSRAATVALSAADIRATDRRRANCALSTIPHGIHAGTFDEPVQQDSFDDDIDDYGDPKEVRPY
jgi:hypothetical protein